MSCLEKVGWFWTIGLCGGFYVANADNAKFSLSASFSSFTTELRAQSRRRRALLTLDFILRKPGIPRLVIGSGGAKSYLICLFIEARSCSMNV